jgi:hypothetical protein
MTETGFDNGKGSGAGFEIWGIVEIMGHSIIAGKISEQTVAGAPLLRVDVPTVDGGQGYAIPGYTKFYSPGAIYAITPTDEETCKNAAVGLRCRPIEVWKLNLPQLTAPAEKSPFGEDQGDEWEAEELGQGYDGGTS